MGISNDGKRRGNLWPQSSGHFCKEMLMYWREKGGGMLHISYECTSVVRDLDDALAVWFRVMRGTQSAVDGCTVPMRLEGATVAEGGLLAPAQPLRIKALVRKSTQCCSELYDTPWKVQHPAAIWSPGAVMVQLNKCIGNETTESPKWWV